jgi:hypothetical protein
MQKKWGKMGNSKSKLSLKHMWAVFTNKYCLVCKSLRFIKKTSCKLRCKKNDTK